MLLIRYEAVQQQTKKKYQPIRLDKQRALHPDFCGFSSFTTLKMFPKFGCEEGEESRGRDDERDESRDVDLKRSKTCLISRRLPTGAKRLETPKPKLDCE